jgi:hypothetical protein
MPRLARIVHPSAPGIPRLGVEERREALARIGRGEANDPRRARDPRQQRRLQQPLQIDGDIVVRPAHLADRRGHRHSVRGAAAIVDDQRSIDRGDEIENRGVPRADQPVDARRGKRAA